MAPANKIQSTFAALVGEVQIDTVDRLFAFLETKIDMDEDMQSFFAEFKGQLKAEVPKTRKKTVADGKKVPRTPTVMNCFVKIKMAALKADGLTGNLMKEAMEAWNEEKTKDTDMVKEAKKMREDWIAANVDPKEDPKAADKEAEEDPKVKEEPKTKAAKPAKGGKKAAADDAKPAKGAKGGKKAAATKPVTPDDEKVESPKDESDYE